MFNFIGRTESTKLPERWVTDDECYRVMVENLNPRQVIHHLVEGGVIASDLFNKDLSITEINEQLLNVMKTKKDTDKIKFKEALEKTYQWHLVNYLENSGNPSLFLN